MPTIRVATTKDLAALQPCLLAFNAGEGVVIDEARLMAACRILVTSPHLGCLLICADEDVDVGYAVVTFGFDLEWGGPDSYLTELWVSPSHRGRGLGRELLEAATDAAKAHGAGAIHLMVREQNAAAVSLYETNGFTSPPRRFYTRVLR